MTAPYYKLTTKALRARWENVGHGQLNVTQVERRIYTDDPAVVAAEIVRQAGIDDPAVVAGIRDIKIKVARKKAWQARCGETVALLEDKLAVTRNPSFGAAVEALRKCGFGQPAGTLRMYKKQNERVYVTKMHELLTRDKARSVPHAAAIVAVMFWISGASFDAVVKTLRRKYTRAKPFLLARQRLPRVL